MEGNSVRDLSAVTLRGSVSDAAAGFARVLLELGTAADDIVYFTEKPHKWDGEYRAWLEHGSPSVGDDGWDAFVAAFDEAQRR